MLTCTQAAGNYYNTVIMIISSMIMRKANDSQGNGSALDTVHVCSLVEGAHEVEDLFYWLCSFCFSTEKYYFFHF